MVTERVDRAMEQTLTGERNITPGIRDSSLTPLEQQRFDELAAIMRSGSPGCLNADSELWRLDYVKKPPDIEEFILKDYFLGRSWRPIEGENEGIWPAWIELLSAHLNVNSRIHNMVITGSLGIGKCLGYNELCLMSDGTVKPVQEIKAGELLMGDDSTPRKVLSTTRGRGPLYQIYPAKGEPFVCNDAHVLCLKSSVSSKIEHVSVTDFLKWPRQKRHQARLYRTGCDWVEKPVAVDPYWLGLWLGDGDTDSPTITTADDEIAAYHTAYAQSFGLHVTVGVDKRGNAAKTYSASVIDRKKARIDGNPLRNLLKSYGLCALDGSQEKHIPSAYLFNSKHVRQKVFAGLIDTDGSKSTGGKRAKNRTAKQSNGVYEITVKPKKFADSIRFLAQSLGYFAQTKIKICNSTAYYRTIISGAYDANPKLLRKQTGKKGQPVTSPITGHQRQADCLKTKFAVIPLDEGDYYGFELDGNHRFLLKDFTVTHNTAMMVTVLLYRMCIATYLKNPQHFFGLNRNSNIVYNLLSVTKEAVKDTAFGTAMTYMSDSPYFLEVCKYNAELDYSGYRVPMENTLPDGRLSRIWLTAGSKGQHVLGRNLVGIGLDEGNFRLEKDPDLKAYELYDQVRTRIANRFQKIEAYLPAISIIASSAQDESSFTEKVVGEIEESNRQRDLENRKLPAGVEPRPISQIVFRNAVYKIKRHALTGIGPDHHWFKVAYGLKNMEPFIMSGWYTEDGEPVLDEPHEEPPNGAKTELVPKFYHEAYRRNCKSQLQNLSGISCGGAHRLFPSLIDIEHCIQVAAQEGVPNPLKPGIQRIPISSEDNKNIWDYLEHKSFLTRVASRIQPIRHPQSQRYAHLDLATQSLAGVAVCHLAGSQLVEGLVKDGEPFAEYRLIVEYDFILTICAGQNKPINLGKIQKFFFWLRDMCSYRFGLITADMYQSVMPLQELEARQFKVDKLSVDKDKSVYTAWRAGFEEHRIRLPRNEQMIREAENLLEMDKKFDHPPDGCFTGDTKVKLLNGTTKSLTELAQETKPVWIYANTGKGEVIPAKAVNARKTKTVTELVEVTLDNQKVVRCTPDHRFMLKTGGYCAAKNLKAGDSLMPLYTKLYKVRYQRGTGYYEQVWSEGNWRMTHKLVAKHCGFPARTGEVIHHASLNSLNNDPDLLERLTASEHNRRHVLISKATSNPEIVKRRALTFKMRYSNNSAFIAKKQKAGKIVYKGMTTEQKARLHASVTSLAASQRTSERNKARWADPVYRSKMTQRLADYAKSETGRQNSAKTAARTNRENRQNWSPERLAKHRQSIQKAATIRLQKCLPRNHKVISCRSVTVPPTDVYDISIPGVENFGLEAGVFVHNSKDTTDGAAGAYFNAVNSEEKISMSSHNAPSMYTGQQMQQYEQEAPPVAIPLPARGYTRSKVFKA